MVAMKSTYFESQDTAFLKLFSCTFPKKIRGKNIIYNNNTDNDNTVHDGGHLLEKQMVKYFVLCEKFSSRTSRSHYSKQQKAE